MMKRKHRIMGYDVLGASVDHGEDRHPQLVMRELGITYKRALPDIMRDAWTFLCCSDVPDDLPPFVTCGPAQHFRELLGLSFVRDEADADALEAAFAEATNDESPSQP